MPFVITGIDREAGTIELAPDDGTTPTPEPCAGCGILGDYHTLSCPVLRQLYPQFLRGGQGALMAMWQRETDESIRQMRNSLRASLGEPMLDERPEPMYGHMVSPNCPPQLLAFEEARILANMRGSK